MFEGEVLVVPPRDDGSSRSHSQTPVPSSGTTLSPTPTTRRPLPLPQHPPNPQSQPHPQHPPSPSPHGSSLAPPPPAPHGPRPLSRNRTPSPIGQYYSSDAHEVTDVSSQEQDDDLSASPGRGTRMDASAGGPTLPSEKAMGKRRAADVQPEEDGTSFTWAHIPFSFKLTTLSSR